MDSRRQSGYLADDESFRRPQMGRSPFDWRRILRPPSRCQFRSQRTSTSPMSSDTLAHSNQGKRKRQQNSSNNSERSNLANEFSEFVDFLADEEVLDSLQLIVEDAVQKLREVTTQSGTHIFDIQEESYSSVESESWSYSYSYSSVQSETRSQTISPTGSSSEDDWERSIRSGHLPKMSSKMCLLDKYIARLPKFRERITGEVSTEIRSETISGPSEDSHLYHQRYIHVWAKLAQSFEQLARRDYFERLNTSVPSESYSSESLHKEITSVLKQRAFPCCIQHYYRDPESTDTMELLEEHNTLVALQDIINQAVLRVLEATMTGGIPFLTFDADGRPIMPWEPFSSQEEEGSSETSDSGEETEGEGKSADERRRKKKEDGMGKSKSAPLPKTKQKSIDEPVRKPKYVPPPLHKPKAKAAIEEVPGKPKYTPPPLPKPRRKQQEAAQGEGEASKSESIIDFLIENAAKLILYKYNYEALLSEKLGFISVPVTKVLLEIMFGYKKIKGSGIRLSSQIDWTKVYDEIYKKRPPKPKPPKQDKKKKPPKRKGGVQKDGDQKKEEQKDKKAVVVKSPDLPKGKVVVSHQETESIKKESSTVSKKEPEISKAPDIFEIVPPRFSKETEPDLTSADEGSPTRFSSQNQPSMQHKLQSAGTSSNLDTPKRLSISTRRPSILSQDNRGSSVALPGVDSTSQLSEIRANKSSSFKMNHSEEGSKTVLPKISN